MEFLAFSRFTWLVNCSLRLQCINFDYFCLDGAHQKDEDFAYFHLPPVPSWSVAETTLFGISCNRQIASKVKKALCNVYVVY